MTPDHQHQHQQNGSWALRFKWGVIAAIAVIAYFLLSEHRAHFIEFLPYLLLLACPLMHIFMHGGHEPHGDQDNDGKPRAKKDKGE